jgi:hypothetical protein
VLDVSPATDSRPFFFNMVHLDPQWFGQAVQLAGQGNAGVVRGNLLATGTLLLIIMLSAVVVAVTIVLPMRPSVRAVDRRLAVAGTAYFALIGLGFIFVEIGVIQRISVFLGHPVYALSVGLFSIILATGIGSFASERILLRTRSRFAVWASVLAGYIALLPEWFPVATAATESATDLVARPGLRARHRPGGHPDGHGLSHWHAPREQRRSTTDRVVLGHQRRGRRVGDVDRHDVAARRAGLSRGHAIERVLDSR